MAVIRRECMPIRAEEDVVLVRQAVRKWAHALSFSLIDQTKIVTAASELARNTLVHGGGGELVMESMQEGVRAGLRLTFADEGPGIANLEQALTDGFTTAGGMGLGLGGARRLVNDFELSSQPGQGTRVTICRWK